MNDRKLLQTDFYLFYRYLFGAEHPTNWWVKAYCDFLQEAYLSYLKQERPIYCVEAPVQHGKTTVLRYYIAWLIGRHPDKRFNYYSADENLRDETSTAVLNILVSEKYNNIFGPRVMDFNRKQIIISETGDKVQFRIMGGGNVGYPSHFSIIDDPYSKKEDAMSEVQREKVYGQFSSDIISRRQNDSLIVITHSRWHVDDLIGKIKEIQKSFKNPVKFFSHSAIAMEDDEHRKNGEALFPEFRNIDFLNGQRAIMTDSEFMALYQQNPTVEGGNLFKLDWFLFVPRGTLPKEDDYDYRYIVADTAYKEKQQNDFTVFLYCGVKDNKLYLIDMIRRQISSIDVLAWCEKWIVEKTQDNFRYLWIEDKGHGIYLNQYFRKTSAYIPDEDTLKNMLDRKLDKVMRANNSIARIDKNCYNVIINSDIKDIDALKMELMTFPNGKHDDIEDCVTDAIKIAFAGRDYVSEYKQLLRGNSGLV